MPPSHSVRARSLIALLVPLTLLGVVSLPVSAAPADQKVPTHDVLKEPVEIEAKRTKTSKTFRLPNGNFQTQITANPMPKPKVDENGMSLISSTEWVDGTPTCRINSALATSDCAGASIKVGKNGSTDRSLIAFDLSPIYKNVNVTQAPLALYQSSSLNGTAVPLQLHDVTKQWSTSTTWTKATSSVNWTTAGGDFNTTQIGGLSNATYTGYQYVRVTEAVSKWVSGATANNGWLLKTNEASTNVLTYASSNAPNGSQRPVLTVEYGYETSPRSFHTTWDQKINDRTGLSVNLGNGNLSVNALDI
jgi:hypothetical protein